MNIVSWNCNGAFRDKYKFLAAYQPDVAVVPESESPCYLSKNSKNFSSMSHVWNGFSSFRGLSIFTFNGYRAKIADFYDSRFSLVLPVMIFNATACFLLVAVWTKFVGKMKESYVAQAYNAVCFYEKYFDDNTLIMGDFNSNKIWDNTSGNRVAHDALVQKLEGKNFGSVYHELRQEPQGAETQPTQYQYRHKSRPNHIDYMFMNKNRMRDINAFSIGSYNDWQGKSDHMPLFMNVKDRC